jgi:CRP/FNR family transcriptional regulator, nitrogen oxide reductase regulator
MAVGRVDFRTGLQNAAIFEGLSAQELDLVVSQASIKAIPKGASLFRQHEPAREMFLLESGRVRVHEVTVGGRELLVRLVRPGDVFGDKAAIPDAKYGATATSESPVRAYVWAAASLATLLNEVPRLAINLFNIATRNLHSSRERYRILATLSAEARIRWALTELARGFGLAQGNATAIIGRAIQQDIADLAATTIYTVSRVLRRYEQRGMLTRKRGRIVLLRSFQKTTSRPHTCSEARIGSASSRSMHN